MRVDLIMNGTNVGFMSSICPTTKDIWPHTWGKMANTGCLIVKKLTLSICMQIKQCHVERQCIYAYLSCVGFNVCELITND